MTTDHDMDQPLVLTVPEAAQLLRISRAFAYELIARGDLPALRLGRRLVIPRHALDTLLNLSEDIHPEHASRTVL